MNIKAWLKENSITEISKRDMPSPFKVYKPLDSGNVKLDKGIFSFSLLPYVTCPFKCEKCYDLKSLRHKSVRDKRLYNTYMAINYPDKLKRLIIKQIMNSRTIKYVRIHVGGDFFSQEYVNLWKDIKGIVSTLKPGIKFYTYTKTVFLQQLKDADINVVDSILPSGSFNYGPLESLEKLKSLDNSYSICPAYKTNPNYSSVKCGKTCTHCMDKSKVLFVIH